MIQPTVCAVMLTAGRPEMARRAVEAFRAQMYPAKRLLILDSGPSRFDAHVYIGNNGQPDNERLLWNPGAGEPVGQWRNIAALQSKNVDILIHWDDDDYSHPNRIAEQVELLQSSGADAVGYNEMLFWREKVSRSEWHTHPDNCPCGTCGPGRREVATATYAPGEAWLYTGSILGTSLCYWRRTWERRPFQAKSVGEDYEFLKGLKTATQSALWEQRVMMIARIHGGNTSPAYDPADMARKWEWKRIPAWDAYCREVMDR